MPPPLMSQRAIPPNMRGPPPRGPVGQSPRGSLLGQPPGPFMRGPFDPRNAMNNMRPPFGGPQGNAPLLPNMQVFYLFIIIILGLVKQTNKQTNRKHTQKMKT